MLCVRISLQNVQLGCFHIGLTGMMILRIVHKSAAPVNAHMMNTVLEQNAMGLRRSIEIVNV